MERRHVSCYERPTRARPVVPIEDHPGRTVSRKDVMAHWFEDNAQSIGRTPLVRINHLQDRPRARILAKIEGRNPAYSVKCRLGAAMVWDAEKRGVLGPGKEIIEPTSGNTGIALAFVAAARCSWSRAWSA